jgi:hypothetical protein
MQELSSRFRETGLNIFRHRRGMLFVTSVRARPFTHEEASVSAHVQAILQTLGANPGMNRKDLADKILTDVPAENAEARKMELASDLRWLISEGNVIEFNDGSLDLPRVKVKAVETRGPKTSVAATGRDGDGAGSVPNGAANKIERIPEAATGEPEPMAAAVEPEAASPAPAAASQEE